jgi:hypothetical protein
MAEDFFKRFDQEMQRRYPPPEAPAAAATQAPVETAAGARAAAAPAHTGVTTAVPKWVWGFAVVVLLAVLWLLLIR